MGCGESGLRRCDHDQSHGEAFLSLFRHGLGDSGLFLLDEPEGALSPSRQLAFLVLLRELERKGCQFIIATHSPIVLAYPGATLLSFDSSPLAPIAYEDTEHYQVTRALLNDRERFLQRLFCDGEG